ncbi:diacylglycerol/lipid kinase family protein [Legionella bozemanae]|uniref:Diacylglycerol kinase n=1 Tax=Legionella bozemanae TaxID=447 RepID=A0A0W0RT70_LEGBO|nr:diacylglycerol kinase family protein [Legionella bozemanae]KTC74265.1 Diacylglycerol kinase [Legionella bozemanae]STO33858.1 Putative lipid kinase BmrU [Legionella bozemanae]
MDTIAVIINKMAKNSSKAILYLEGLKGANISYILYETTPKNLPKTIKKCINKYKVILIGGGDGTIRTAAHYCVHTSIILGVIPLGTLNHFAKELGLPSGVQEIVASLKKLHTIKIDLAEVNDNIFINNSSIGFYPKFADKREQYNKNYNKWLSYIPGFIESLKKHPVFTLTVKSKNLDLSLHTSFLMVSNNIYCYKFPATIKRESFHKALLGLYYFKQGKIQIFKIIQSIFCSKNLFERIQSKHPIEIHFKNEKEITISLDGDTIKTKTPLYYRTLSRSLTLLKSSS